MTSLERAKPVDGALPEEAARLVEQLRLNVAPPTEAVERLHQLLAQARAQPSQPWADLLVDLASDARTVTWQDVRRRATFEVARETLLAMGYPYAFQLEPDTLLGPPKDLLVGGRALVLGGLALLWNLGLLVVVLASQDEWSTRALVAVLAFCLALLQSGWSLALSSARAAPWLRGLALAGAGQLALLAGVVFSAGSVTSVADWLGVLALGAPTLALSVDLALRARAEDRLALDESTQRLTSEDALGDGAPTDDPQPEATLAPIAPVTEAETAADAAAPEHAASRAR